MIPLVLIFAVLTEPPEAITDDPWDYVTPLEFIDVIPFEDLERELNRKRFRILEAPNADRR